MKRLAIVLFAVVAVGGAMLLTFGSKISDAVESRLVGSSDPVVRKTVAAALTNPNALWVRENQVAVDLHVAARAADASLCGNRLRDARPLLAAGDSTALREAAALCEARVGDATAAIAMYETMVAMRGPNGVGDRDYPADIRQIPSRNANSPAAQLVFGAMQFYDLPGLRPPGGTPVNRHVARALYDEARRERPSFIARLESRTAPKCPNPQDAFVAVICDFGVLKSPTSPIRASL
jgi:hypothetical protein